jgi:hypothetical protein
VLESEINFMTRYGSSPDLIAAAQQFQSYGLWPPMALWTLSASAIEASKPSYDGRFLAALAGMGLYATATALLLEMTRLRFGELTSEAPEAPPKTGS